MNILIAEDDPVSRRLLYRQLQNWGHEIEEFSDGKAALDFLISVKAPPQLAVLDWMMPEMDGLELCRKIREDPKLASMYIIFLTAKTQKEDIITGLAGGANDYVAKPFDPEELRVRVEVGVRVIDLQNNLADKVEELEAALNKVQLLHGLLPICSYCKQIRTEADEWEQMERYISEHSEAEFSHGICPDCYAEHIQPVLDEDKAKKSNNESSG